MTAHKRSCVPLTQRTEKSLVTYALTATTAGVGILAMSPSSEAKVLFTPTHQLLTAGSLFLDLNNDGVTDFTISESSFKPGAIKNTGSFHSGGNLSVAGAQAGNQVVGYGSILGFASALNGGLQVGPSNHFLTNNPQHMFVCLRTSFSTVVARGKWSSVQNKFLGLKFTLNGKTHFGWARMSVKRSACHITALLTGYAVETIANKTILTGQTQATAEIGDVLAPEAATPTLGLLARGAPALDIWRRD